MYMYGNTLSAFTTEPLNGCLQNLAGMKCSWPRTCIKVFRPYPPSGGSRCFFGVSHFAYSNAIFIDFYAVKSSIYIYFV